ncbi:MAG: twin-arginine translocase subunit TatC [Pirellulaceae bacterium]
MLKKQPADDLFEKSSMTFGEHLEELRKCLGKAFLWLVAGTCIGLFFAESIVQFIETPLKAAIYDFYVERAKSEFEEANGEVPSKELAGWMSDNGMMPERVFFDPAAMLNLQKELSQQEIDDLAAGDQTDDNPTDDNPWKGVDIDKLLRLKPILIWRPIPNKLVALTATEPFMMFLKAGLVAGVVISSPGIFWHIWQFFAAGLYPHERRYVYWYLPLSLVLFFAGVCLAFFVVFRLVLGFLMTYTTGLDVEFTPRLNDYMSFALFLPLGFGIAFQLPIVMLGLHRFGVVTAETYIAQWRIAVLAIAFLSMILTPAEIYSMVGLFVPLTGLYFFGIFLCKYMPKGAGIGSAAFDPT